MVKSAVFMILILDAVNRADKFVSASLIDSWKDKIHDEKYTEMGKNLQHTLVIIKMKESTI